MGQQQLLAAMQQQKGNNWNLSGMPQVNQGMGLMGPGAANAYADQIQAAQDLPPTVSRMQGGFGLNPQMLSLLSQVAQTPQSAPPQVQPAFAMRPQVQQAARLPYGPGNWSR